MSTRITVGRIVGAVVAVARRPDRRPVTRDLLRQLVFAREGRIEMAYLSTLLPDVVGIQASIEMDVDHDWELPYSERCVLDAIIRARAPAVMFEFGTFTGRTTRLMARAAPSAIVHTIDLPADRLRALGLPDVIGTAFTGSSYEDRIVQHRSDAASFDFQQFASSVDLVFVDAGHEYEDVIRDSHDALRLVSPGGLVLWDDYHPRHPGVVQALNEVSEVAPLARIARTRLVVHSAPP